MNLDARKKENAEGVPEISRGSSYQRERYPRSTIKTSRTLEGCKSVLFTAQVVRSFQGRGRFGYPVSGGVAALNPRLISRIPSGCRSAAL